MRPKPKMTPSQCDRLDSDGNYCLALLYSTVVFSID